MKSSMYRSPPMAGSRGPHISIWMRCRGSAAQEVVFGVKSFRADLHCDAGLTIAHPGGLRRISNDLLQEFQSLDTEFCQAAVR